MKRFINCIIFCLVLIGHTIAQVNLQGAWEMQTIAGDISQTQLILFSGDYFTWTTHERDNGAFISTKGGSWKLKEDLLILEFEFHTVDTSLIGLNEKWTLSLNKNNLQLKNLEGENSKDLSFKDANGNQGSSDLSNPWLFHGRKRNGELTFRDVNLPRKTMKILTADRFQWIAYNVDTKQFFGTGGGKYELNDGQYIENIKFFSRDNSRVGASLTFNYEIVNGDWHHSGYSSKGAPMYEIWSKRK